MNPAEQIIRLESIPFHMGVRKKPSNNPFPDCLPFCIGLRKDINLLVQIPTEEVETCLDKVYLSGSVIGTPMNPRGLGRLYAEDFYEFVKDSLKEIDFKDLKMLEIGCGTGYLLSKFKKDGALVLGIEPGAELNKEAKQHNIQVVQDYFPSQKIKGKKFNIIVQYCVLEHIKDSDSFLQTQKDYLDVGGKIIISVPDCAKNIENADISMFTHEHYNYFNNSSLTRLLETNGFTVDKITKSNYGGCIYVIASLNDSTNRHNLKTLDFDALKFKNKLHDNIRRLSNLLESAEKEMKSIAVFPAIRIINYIHIIKPAKMPRFFDDDSRLHGLFYPPIPVVVESREDLCKKPVDIILVFTDSFGKKLKKELQEKLKDAKIILLEELM